MCNYKVVSQNDYGTILNCEACERFQIKFGVITVNLSSDFYHGFKIRVKSLYTSYTYWSNTSDRLISLDDYNTHSKVLLKYSELEKLNHLVSSAGKRY